MKAGLLRGAGGGTNGTSITSGKIDSLFGQPIKVRSEHIRQPLFFSLVLTILSNGTPAQIIHIQIENIWTLCTLCKKCPKEQIRTKEEVYFFHNIEIISSNLLLNLARDKT
jgi:hypothetical protein